MTTDDTMTAKGPWRSIPDLIASAVPGVLQARVRDAAFDVLSDPEVLDAMAGALRETGNDLGLSLYDMESYILASALADRLRGQG